MSKNKALFSDAHQQLIKAAIAEAEKNTSGEIKLHVEPFCKTDPLQRALQLFAQLELQHTAQRNGVLFYMAIEDHKFAILGDEGIHKVVGKDFWESTKEHMRGFFAKGDLIDGLCAGIRMAGQQLKAHFPYEQDDKNELSDDISFGGHPDA